MPEEPPPIPPSSSHTKHSHHQLTVSNINNNLHSRKSSVNTTNTITSNTTYGLLDYYTGNETDDESLNFSNNHQLNNNNITTLTTNTINNNNANNSVNLNKGSHLKEMININNNNNNNDLQEIDELDESTHIIATSTTNTTTTTTTSSSTTTTTTNNNNNNSRLLSPTKNLSSSHITKHENLNDLSISRAQFNEFKIKLNNIMSIKEKDSISSSSFSTNFRNKSQLKQSIKNSKFDRYGFQKTNQYISNKDYNDWWNEYCPYLIRRKLKWIKFLEKNGLYYNSNNIPNKFPLKSDEMLKFVKKGIPAEWRGNAWFNFVNGNELLKKNNGLYDELVKQSIDLVNENTDSIEKDLHRTFPDNIFFKNYIDPKTNFEIESPMLNTLRRILKCFSLYKPSIGYCQSLNFITGLLLLFMNEEQTFWMLVIITEKFLPGVHESNLEGLAVNQGMLLLCLKQYLPDVWKIIMDNDKDDLNNFNDLNNNNNNNDDDTSYLFFLPTLTFCTTSWFMSLFIGVLPIETTLRIWDIIFYENSKTIFQISLGIFKMLDPELRKIYCKAYGLSNNSNLTQLNLHSDSDLLSKLNSSNNKSCSSLNDSLNYNKEFLSSELFQLIQNTPKRILNVNLFLDECFRQDSSSFNSLTQSEIKRCRNFVIQSRERHSNLIEKRKELGMSQEERKELLKQERELLINNSKNLNSVWENHNKFNKKFSNIDNNNSNTNTNNNNNNNNDNNYNNNNNNNNGINSINTRGLRTAYWNVGLNRRIKKIYSKGTD